MSRPWFPPAARSLVELLVRAVCLVARPSGAPRRSVGRLLRRSAELRDRARRAAATFLLQPSERAQSTVEYALILLGAAAIALVVVAWVTRSDAIGRLFDTVLGRVLSQAT